MFMQEKAGAAIRDTLERGRLMPEEGRRLMEDLSVRVEARGEGLHDIVENTLGLGLRAAGLATGSDVNAIKRRLLRIQSKLDELEQR
jgi:polyhydroxyalkanoate synthesis regulator phasin